MAEILYSTSTTEKGPWLIERAKVESLNAIISSEWARLGERERREMASEVQELLADYRKTWKDAKPEKIEEKRREYEEQVARRWTYRLKRSVAIICPGGKRFQGETFEEILRDAALEEEAPVGLSVQLNRANVTCTLDLPDDGRLRLSVGPETFPEARELYVAVGHWVGEVRAPAWQRIWLALRGVQWFLLLSFFWGLVVVMEIRAKRVDPSREQAHAILKDGLQEDEIYRAVELLLKLESGFPSPEPLKGQSLKSRRLWAITGCLFLACVALSFWPTVCIGIGRGRSKLEWWRWWLRVVSVIVPGFIVGSFVLPWLTDAIRALFQ